MKKSIFLLVLCIVLVKPSVYSQETMEERSQMLDVKLQLLDSKLELLDAKIKLWEAKPKELDVKLDELDSKIQSMDFEPAEFRNRLDQIDSLVRLATERVVEEPHFEAVQPAELPLPEQPVFNPVYKSTISLDPARLLEGTFCMSYERILNPRFSVMVSGMATYSTSQGISNMYFSNQSFSYFDAISNTYQSYAGEVIAGGGFGVQFRNYLLASHPGRKQAPLGLYAAPQFIYRQMKITGYSNELVEVDGKWERVDVEVHQHLRVYALGAVLGMKVPLFKAISVDVFAGGNIRLSKYNGEKGFTKYKDWFNIDYSGVSPVIGVAIGILK